MSRQGGRNVVLPTIGLTLLIAGIVCGVIQLFTFLLK